MQSHGKNHIFIVCGKSPLTAFGGGYSSYALNLSKVLYNLGYSVYIVTFDNRNQIIKKKNYTLLLTKIPFLDAKVSTLPFLPIVCLFFGKEIISIAKELSLSKITIWGIGPWGLTGILVKIFSQRKVILINNYFTSLKHEWEKALEAVKIKDYGIFAKCKYAIVYYILIQIMSIFEQLLLKRADSIVTNYLSTEKILKKQFSITKSKFFRTRFFVQTYKRETDVKSKKIVLPKKYILLICRQDPRKGVNFLLCAMAILLSKGVKIPLLIIGDGELLLANKNLAKKMNLSKIVSFLGFVNDYSQILKLATIFCLPSIEEGAGALVLNEAMAQGLPIVSTSCDGIVEDLKNGKEALLVEPMNPQALANALEEVLGNPKLAQKLGNNAKLRYQKQFGIEKMEKDVKRLLGRFL